jgi:hypothetical protein
MMLFSKKRRMTKFLPSLRLVFHTGVASVSTNPHIGFNACEKCGLNLSARIDSVLPRPSAITYNCIFDFSSPFPGSLGHNWKCLLLFSVSSVFLCCSIVLLPTLGFPMFFLSFSLQSVVCLSYIVWLFSFMESKWCMVLILFFALHSF